MPKEPPVRYNIRIDFNEEGQLRLSPAPSPSGKWVEYAEVEKLERSLEYWKRVAKIALKEE